MSSTRETDHDRLEEIFFFLALRTGLPFRETKLLEIGLEIFISVQRSSTGVKKRPKKDGNEKLEFFFQVVDAPRGWRKARHTCKGPRP